MVGELGVGYLKLDYNINGAREPTCGYRAREPACSAHNRAHLEWLDAVLDRYPELVIENCASGGMRTDYAPAVPAPAAVDQRPAGLPPLPADHGRRARPRSPPSRRRPGPIRSPASATGEIVFTLCGALLGRIHLSGHIDQMSEHAARLVADAVRRLQADPLRPARTRLPFWPLGLPRWTDSWLALGIRAPGRSYIAVWHRGDDDAAGATAILPIAHLRGTAATSVIMFSGPGAVSAQWDAGAGALSVSLPSPPAACLVALR